MGEILNQMLENYLVSSNVQLQKRPDSLSFTINSTDGISKTTLFNILPYMHLISLTFTLDLCREKSQKMLCIILCSLIIAWVAGLKCFWMIILIFISKKKIFVSADRPRKVNLIFPQNIIAVSPCILILNFFTEANSNVEDLFIMNLSQLPEIYFEKKDTYIAEASSEMRRILDRLWQFYEALSPFYMKLSVLELLHLLLDSRNVVQEKNSHFLYQHTSRNSKKSRTDINCRFKTAYPCEADCTAIRCQRNKFKKLLSWSIWEKCFRLSA